MIMRKISSIIIKHNERARKCQKRFVSGALAREIGGKWRGGGEEKVLTQRET